MGYKTKSRTVIRIPIAILLSVILLFRVGWWQFVRGDQLRAEAAEQQTRDRLIQSPRGSILDRNGKELAVSTTVETVSITPSEVRNNDNYAVVASAGRDLGAGPQRGAGPF